MFALVARNSASKCPRSNLLVLKDGLFARQPSFWPLWHTSTDPSVSRWKSPLVQVYLNVIYVVLKKCWCDIKWNAQRAPFNGPDPGTPLQQNTCRPKEDRGRSRRHISEVTSHYGDKPTLKTPQMKKDECSANKGQKGTVMTPTLVKRCRVQCVPQCVMMKSWVLLWLGPDCRGEAEWASWVFSSTPCSREANSSARERRSLPKMFCTSKSKALSADTAR